MLNVTRTLPEVTVEVHADRFWRGLPLRPSVITIVRFMLGAIEDASLANFHGDDLLGSIGGRPQRPKPFRVGIGDERLVVLVQDVGVAMAHQHGRLDFVTVGSQMVGTETVAQCVVGPLLDSSGGAPGVESLALVVRVHHRAVRLA